MHRHSETSLLASSGPVQVERSPATVRDQVQQLQANVEHLQKVLEGQRKQHNDLFLQVKKLEESGSANTMKLMEAIEVGTQGLLGKIQREDRAADKELSYLEMQNNMLVEEQRKLADMTLQSTIRQQQLAERVGL